MVWRLFEILAYFIEEKMNKDLELAWVILPLCFQKGLTLAVLYLNWVCRVVLFEMTRFLSLKVVKCHIGGVPTPWQTLEINCALVLGESFFVEVKHFFKPENVSIFYYFSLVWSLEHSHIKHWETFSNTFLCSVMTIKEKETADISTEFIFIAWVSHSLYKE